MSNSNVVRHDFQISKLKRNLKNKHDSFVIWFTGLSGSGKSTIANKVEEILFEKNVQTYILDGDNIRMGINRDLGFNEVDRRENLRRIAEIARLFVDAGIVTLAAFVSPLEKDREFLRELIGGKSFIEVYVSTNLETCEKRDVKGLYRKARSGEIKNFTGIDAPYEEPIKPDIIINTENESAESAARRIIAFVGLN